MDHSSAQKVLGLKFIDCEKRESEQKILMRLAQERCSFSDKLKITRIENLGKLVGSLANLTRNNLFIPAKLYFRSGVSVELSSTQCGQSLSVLIWLSALLILSCPVEMVQRQFF